MKEEDVCLKNGTCCDYHEGLCMVFDKPKKVSRIKKCPLDAIDQVIY